MLKSHFLSYSGMFTIDELNLMTCMISAILLAECQGVPLLSAELKLQIAIFRHSEVRLHEFDLAYILKHASN